MGLSFGKSSSKTGPSTVGVYAPQAPSLAKGFAQAGANLDAQNNTPFYQGDLFAGMDNGLLGRILTGAQGYADKASQWGQNVGDSANKMIGLGSGGFLDKLQTDLSNPFGARDAGDAYANSDVATNLVGAANRDVTRQLTENDLPATHLAAVGSGNTNSSRVGARDAILQRGAEDRMADNSATIRGQMFDRGANDYNTNVNNRQAQLAQLFSNGLAGYNSSQDLSKGTQDLLGGAAAIDQQNRQGFADQGFNKWQGQDQRQSDLLNRFWQIVGGNIGQTLGGASKSSGFNFGISASKGS